MPQDSSGNILPDPNIALNALLGAARIRDRRAGMAQQQAQFQQTQDLAKQEADLRKKIADFKLKMDEWAFQQQQEQQQDVETLTSLPPGDPGRLAP